MRVKIVRISDRSENIDLLSLQNMISFHNVHEKCRWLFWAQQISDEVNRTFYPLLTLIFGMSTFCSNYSSTSLWHGVNIFPENFNTHVVPCLLQLKPKAFLWMYNRSVQFIFQLADIEVPVQRFQCSSRFLPLQVVPAIVCFMGVVKANSTKQLKPLKHGKCSNNFGYHCITYNLYYNI